MTTRMFAHRRGRENRRCSTPGDAISAATRHQRRRGNDPEDIERIAARSCDGDVGRTCCRSHAVPNTDIARTRIHDRRAAERAFPGADERVRGGTQRIGWKPVPAACDPGPVSWDERFAADYETWSAHMTADIAFYVELARRADGPLVELAVGNGRVAIPVARATGERVIGIDTSPAMLEQARTGAARAGVDLDLRLGDMRDLDLTEPAALIYCPFRALLHLPTWADRRRTFERVAAALAPAGRFAWNALAMDHRLAATLDGQHQQNPVPHTVHYSVGDNRIDLVRGDGATSRLWWATRNEWLGLLDVAGLQLETLHGGFAGEPFTDDSDEYVFVARRR